jgi:hypothetical protein
MPCAFYVQSMQTFLSSDSVTPHLDGTYPFQQTYSLAGTEAGQTINMQSCTINTKYRNINLLSIGYAFRPGLRTD